MAVEHFGDGDLKTYIAGEDLSSDQYRIVILSAAMTVTRPNAATDDPHGILQNAPENGEAAIVAINGTSKLVAGETIAVGEYVKLEYNSAADAGKGLDADAENDNSIGVCVIGGDEDDLISVAIDRRTVGVQTEAT